MTPNAKLSESLPVVAAMLPATVNSTPAFSSYAAAKDHGQLLAVVALGNMAAETIDVAIYEAEDASGTNAQSLKAATQLAAHASNNDNKLIVFNVRPEELSDGFTHIAVRVVTGDTTGGPVSAVILGGYSRFEPTDDLAAVVQVVD